MKDPASPIDYAVASSVRRIARLRLSAMPWQAACSGGGHKTGLVVVEFEFAGGVGVVANLAPASHLHIVEVVFACAGCRCIVNSIIFPGEDGFVGPIHQASAMAIGIRDIGPVGMSHHGGVEPTRAVVVDGVAVGGEKALVDKNKSV